MDKPLSEDIFEYAEVVRDGFDAGQPTGFDAWADRAADLEARIAKATREAALLESERNRMHELYEALAVKCEKLEAERDALKQRKQALQKLREMGSPPTTVLASLAPMPDAIEKVDEFSTPENSHSVTRTEHADVTLLQWRSRIHQSPDKQLVALSAATENLCAFWHACWSEWVALASFIGTVQMASGLVFHVFER